jgi:hypothetical protein
MKHVVSIAALLALAMSCDALALGAMASVTIIDRDSGAALSTYYFRGEYWVAGRPGSRYAIAIRNGTAGRLLAVASVDGVNVLSGATAGWDQSGYVFDPGGSYQITGWRKSNAEVAAFTFTESPNSYAARTARPANVGVIGVALFRERPPLTRYAPPKVAPAAGPTREAAPDRAQAAQSALARSPMPAPALGTGHGERENSYVEETEFQRLQREPNEVIRIRYDSLENLVAMGVIGRAPPVPWGPNPFPGSPERQFVPDPPG